MEQLGNNEYLVLPANKIETCAIAGVDEDGGQSKRSVLKDANFAFPGEDTFVSLAAPQSGFSEEQVSETWVAAALAIRVPSFVLASFRFSS